MTYRVSHINKKTGATYVYSAESYWDKERKTSKNRQMYLGRLDEETGEIVSRKCRTVLKAGEAGGTNSRGIAAAKALGPNLLIGKIARETGLTDACRECFAGDADGVLSLIYFIAHKGYPLSRIESWSETNEHPSGGRVTGPRVGALLRALDKEARDAFFLRWANRWPESEYFCYDVAPAIQRAANGEYPRRGGAGIPPSNTAALFGRRGRLPLYAQKLPGAIADLPALKAAIKSLRFSRRKKCVFVLNPEFYRANDLTQLLTMKCRFILAAPAGERWIQEIIGEHYPAVRRAGRRGGSGGLSPVATRLCIREGRRCYLHIFFDAVRVANDNHKFSQKMLGWKAELKSGNTDEGNAEYYERFFCVRKIPGRGRRITLNQSAIKEHRDRCAGFFCLLTKSKMDASEALAAYQNGELAQECFRGSENGFYTEHFGSRPLEAANSLLFARFLALILLSGIQNTLLANEKLKYRSAREVIEALEQIIRIDFPGKCGSAVTAAGSLQKEIMAAFALEYP